MVGFPVFTNFIQSVRQRDLSKKDVQDTALGTSGTELYAGNFTEEYLSKLLDDKGVEVFDQMRRSDGQVRMLLNVVKNPIKSATWTFTPVDESDEEIEIAEFAKHVIMNDIVTKTGKRKTFSDFISEALTMIEFGHSVFEIVHKQVKGHKQFGDYLGIADLGFRHQRSILEWGLNRDGSIIYIRQLVNGDLGVDVDIPGQFLLVFSNEKEGDNYQGISMLRPCYGSWWRKNIYRKLQAIGIERAAKGVPIGIMPSRSETGLTPEQYEAQRVTFQNIIDKLSAHDKNGVILGGDFDIKDLKLSHDADKVQKVITSENVEMSKAFLANFMELGLEQNGGSYSLGSDLSDIFLSGIEYIADYQCEKINLELVEPIIRAKYGERNAYPKLVCKGINDKAGKEFADAIATLLDKGGLQQSPRLQKHLHELYNLPDLDEDIAEQDQQRLMNPPTPPSTPEPEQLTEKKNCCGQKLIRLSDGQRKQFPVSAFIEDRADVLAGIMRDGVKRRADSMLAEMADIIRSGRDVSKVRKAVLSVKMPKDKNYIEQLREWAGTTADKALDNTLEEIGAKRRGLKLADELDKLPKDVRNRIIASVILAAEFADADLEKAVYFSFNETYLKADDAALALELMGQKPGEYLDKQNVDVISSNLASNVTNNVRDDVFREEEVFNEIESFIFTNPSPDSAICQSLVGTVFSKEEYETTEWLPPLHHNCRSYIVAQTTGDPNNRPITGSLNVTDPRLIKQATLV